MTTGSHQTGLGVHSHIRCCVTKNFFGEQHTMPSPYCPLPLVLHLLLRIPWRPHNVILGDRRFAQHKPLFIGPDDALRKVLQLRKKPSAKLDSVPLCSFQSVWDKDGEFSKCSWRWYPNRTQLRECKILGFRERTVPLDQYFRPWWQFLFVLSSRRLIPHSFLTFSPTTKMHFGAGRFCMNSSSCRTCWWKLSVAAWASWKRISNKSKYLLPSWRKYTIGEIM